MNIILHNWWILMIRGILSLVVGVLAFLYPGPVLLAVAMVFGAFALVDGLLALISGFRGGPEREGGWSWVGLGLLGLGAGVLTLVSPTVTILGLVYFMAGWSIFRGILEVTAAIELRKEVEEEWLLALAGVVSISFGILISIMPFAGMLAFAWMAGTYALITGIVQISLSMRFRTMNKEVRRPRISSFDDHMTTAA